jgi:hypothetical protein
VHECSSSSSFFCSGGGTVHDEVNGTAEGSLHLCSDVRASRLMRPRTLLWTRTLLPVDLTPP